MTATVEQSNSFASSGSSDTIDFDSAPTAGNLLIAAAIGGTTLTLDSGQTTWTECQDIGGNSRITMWYKIADGDSTDDNLAFTLGATNQYGWVCAEISDTDGFSDACADVGAYTDEMSGPDASDISSGTTATTAQADEVAVAVFRLRDDNAAITGDSLTNSFTKLEQVGTQFGQTYSLEVYLAWKDLTATGTQETTLSWTSGDTGSRAGIIHTFKKDAAAATGFKGWGIPAGVT